jgi:hypothetical protein
MDKPILFLNGTAQSESFTSPKDVIKESNLPPRDRMAHAEFLKSRFNEAWNDISTQRQQRQALALSMRTGSYIQVKGKSNFELATNSLERVGKNTPRLISTQITTLEDGEKEMHAIIYVPNGQEKRYLKQINDYATKIDTRWNQYKNRTLIESIEDIELALLDNLWQDPLETFPQDIPVWCELWLRTEDINADDIVTKTQEICTAIGIETNKERLDFPERSVIVIRANQQQLQELYAQSDNFAELRLAKEPVSFWSSLYPFEQTEAVDNLLSRIVYDDKGVSVCILDSGINNGHQLLEQFCSDDEMETYHPDWSPADQKGHGTQMAGVALFGDLQEALESRDAVTINHRLFSGKILPPPNFPENDHKLYGYITAETIYRSEIKTLNRGQLYCLAVTSLHDKDREGRPSSWSAEIDKLAFGEEDGYQRLILISAGNARNIVELQELTEYPEINKSLPIQNPAQSWNALTVGAFTEKVRICDPDYREYTPLAQHGELSPHSTTSLSWKDKRWPNKPDIVLEGGNLLEIPDGVIDACNDLCILTTSHSPIIKQFELFDATSAATAKAAWMAAQILSILPNAWPETIRALMVHTAEWTPQLIAQFGNGMNKKEDLGNLLRIAGYGVPNLEKASKCASNHLTLIVQETIQPFMKDGGTKEMHFYELPWPKEALQDLGDQKVTLKITLSFFIEPSPGELQTQNRYTYASHGLRFDLNSPEEANNIESFKKRLNKKAREDKEDKPEYDGLGVRWKIGPTYRNKGTVQSDSITLSGLEIADCYNIAVYPIGGWWKTRKNEKCMEKKARYSLVVSLHTDSEEIDIYTPVANLIAVQIPISF